MFKKQPGILGLKVLIKDNKSLVLTYWSNNEDIAKMEKNTYYIETVRKINNAGILTEPQQVEVFEVPIHLNF